MKSPFVLSVKHFILLSVTHLCRLATPTEDIGESSLRCPIGKDALPTPLPKEYAEAACRLV